MRRWLPVLAAICLLPAATSAGTSTAAGDADVSKLSPAMASIVRAGGYGDFPIAQVVPGYRAGDVYYLARLDGRIDAAAVSELATAGALVRYRFDEIGWVALVSPFEAIAAVTRLDHVTRVEVDRIHEVQQIAVTPAPAVADQAKRGTRDVGAEALWAQGVTGKGVVVGVADSGIDSLHPDLDDQDWGRWGLLPGVPKIESFVDCTTVLPAGGGDCRPSQGYDDNGHGSHVSGIATGSAEGLSLEQRGRLPGIAPEASLAGAKVCLAAGSCLNSSVMAGLRYLATERAEGGAGADVINVSLGSGRFYFAPASGAEQVTNNDPEAQLVNELATKNNVLFTISAGNSGPVLQSLGSPSVASQALSVGAAIADWDLAHPTAQTEHGVYGEIRPAAAAAGATGIAQFSSRGPSGDRLIKPDVTAPGSFYVAAEASTGAEVKAADAAQRHSYSNDPAYAVLSGTSMSSPAAAGTAALVIDGYTRFAGQAPPYYLVKAALANSAGTRAWEGSVSGLTSTLKVKLLGQDPETLFPLRNDDWVGVTGEGAGRVHAPSAILALTQGITIYTPQVGELDDPHELQPSWSLDEVPRGHTAAQTFVARGGPGLLKDAKVTFSVQSEAEPRGVFRAPAGWFALPKPTKVAAGADALLAARLTVPAGAAPGMYAATILAQVKLGKATQTIRIPVQFFVDLVDGDPAEAAGTSVEGPIWASAATDYTAAGFEAGDITTDWATFPLRLAAGTERVDLSVYDPAGAAHMDVFVFDGNGQEVDSTVSFYLDHAVPAGALYAPTTQDEPASISILDGDDITDLALPATVWIAVSNSGPAAAPGFETFNLDVDVVGGTGGGGSTPPERIHSGAHAWWSGSAAAASDSLTEAVDLTGVAAASRPALRFWSWYQLEEGYDWAYVLVSTDGGASWTSLATLAANGSGTTTLDPIGDGGNVLGGGKAYPNGLTGTSGSAAFTGANLFEPVYTEHSADLSPYAGKRILLRFAHTSDAGTNYENLYVDDLSIVDAGGTTLAVGVANPDDVETAGAWSSGGTPGFTWVTADTAG